MTDDIRAWDALEDDLFAKLSAAQEPHAEDPTPENYRACREALMAYGDWDQAASRAPCH